MTALVTGSAGFVGRPLVDRLRSAGRRVVEMDLDAGGGGVDLVDAAAVNEVVGSCAPTTVVHLGGVSGPMLHADDPATVVRVNALGTVNVLAAAASAGVPGLVFAGSVAGYATGSRAEPVPDSVYAATKRFGEQVVGVHRNAGRPGWTSVRIGSVYGARRTTSNPLVTMVRDAVHRSVIRFDPRAVEPLVEIDDCVGYLAELVDVAAPAPRYDLVTATLGHEQIAEVVRAATAGRVRMQPSTDGPPPPQYPGGFDIGPLAAATGRTPQVDLVEGIRRLVDAAREEQDRPSRRATWDS